MADNVPDPDYIMEADADVNEDTMVADEPDEPVDEYYADGMNANHDYELQDRESTPVPEEAVPKKPNVTYLTENKPERSHVVNTAAVDLEVLTQNYNGPPLFERLQYIVDHCPPLQRDATIYLINGIRKDSLNVNRYLQLFSLLEKMEKSASSALEAPSLDQAWVDLTTARCSARLDHLLSEYKKQKDEGVKESTRRAMSELFQHHNGMGNYHDCLRLYSRGMREYCSQFKHIIQMFLQWLEVIIYCNEWARVEPLLVNAERSISDADDAEQRDKQANTRAPAANLQGYRTNRQLIITGRAKIDAISGLAKIVNGKYKLAAEKLIKVDVDLLELPWIIHSSELAHYAVLTSLASFERTDIKKKVLSDATCRKFLEAEPQLVDLLQNFVGSRFGQVFDILATLKDKLLLDPYLADHVESLFKIIRERALVQYLIPFSCASIREIARAFRTTEEAIENEIVKLIDNDKLKAKIDSIGGVVTMHQVDPRQDTYRRIIENCESLIERAQVTLFRSLVYQTRITGQPESRNKRKVGGMTSDDASEPALSLNRKISQAVPLTLKSSRHHGKHQPSEADSSEGSEDPRESEQ